MDFEQLLFRAQSGDEHALQSVIEMYRPLLIRSSIIEGRFDDDLFQELNMILLSCIRKMKI